MAPGPKNLFLMGGGIGRRAQKTFFKWAGGRGVSGGLIWSQGGLNLGPGVFLDRCALKKSGPGTMFLGPGAIKKRVFGLRGL